jgi:hypothetical protein
MQDHNFACGSVWVRNLVSGRKGGAYTERIWEEFAEENISTEERLNDRNLETAA